MKAELQAGEGFVTAGNRGMRTPRTQQDVVDQRATKRTEGRREYEDGDTIKGTNWTGFEGQTGE
jgi:hypothetical protein